MIQVEKSKEGEYFEGNLKGIWTEWHDNGALKSKGNYKGKQKVGPWKYWDAAGNLVKEESFAIPTE